MLDRHVVQRDTDSSRKFMAGHLNALITGDRTAIFGNEWSIKVLICNMYTTYRYVYVVTSICLKKNVKFANI